MSRWVQTVRSTAASVDATASCFVARCDLALECGKLLRLLRGRQPQEGRIVHANGRAVVADSLLTDVVEKCLERVKVALGKTDRTCGRGIGSN